MPTTTLPPINWTFGDILAKLRTDAGLSIAEMAEQADISERSVGNYEHDRTFPKWSTVAMWADACGYPFLAELRESWDSSRRSGWNYDFEALHLFDPGESTRDAMGRWSPSPESTTDHALVA